jgi:DNA-directed RNA polymerase specialized sigma24 family protein
VKSYRDIELVVLEELQKHSARFTEAVNEDELAKRVIEKIQKRLGSNDVAEDELRKLAMVAIRWGFVDLLRRSPKSQEILPQSAPELDPAAAENLSRAVNSILITISQTDRAALSMRLADVEWKNISQKLGIPERTLQRHVERCTQQIKRRLREMAETDPLLRDTLEELNLR